MVQLKMEDDYGIDLTDQVKRTLVVLEDIDEATRKEEQRKEEQA